MVADGARLARPRPSLGYVETYGGFFYDDHASAAVGAPHRIGLRGAPPLEVTAEALPERLESLYRAVAPPGYVERI